jgi:hypothetical protein
MPKQVDLKAFHAETMSRYPTTMYVLHDAEKIDALIKVIEGGRGLFVGSQADGSPCQMSKEARETILEALRSRVSYRQWPVPRT